MYDGENIDEGCEGDYYDLLASYEDNVSYSIDIYANKMPDSNDSHDPFCMKFRALAAEDFGIYTNYDIEYHYMLSCHVPNRPFIDSYAEINGTRYPKDEYEYEDIDRKQVPNSIQKICKSYTVQLAEDAGYDYHDDILPIM